MLLLIDLLAQYGGGGSGGGYSPVYWVIIAIIGLAVVGGLIWFVTRSRSG